MSTQLKIFGTDYTDYDALVATECSDCFIRVYGFAALDIDDIATVYISNFTSHNNSDQLSWSWRLHRIWRIIKGRSDPDFEILSSEVLDNLIKALQECRSVVFNPKETTQNS